MALMMTIAMMILASTTSPNNPLMIAAMIKIMIITSLN
jgi:hypothetical protein